MARRKQGGGGSINLPNYVNNHSAAAAPPPPTDVHLSMNIMEIARADSKYRAARMAARSREEKTPKSNMCLGVFFKRALEIDHGIFSKIHSIPSYRLKCILKTIQIELEYGDSNIWRGAGGSGY